MADYRFTRQFLDELSIFEKIASAGDLENVEETLAAIVQNPSLPRRMPSFYDPALPSYLYRSKNILVHYRVPESGVVEFLNLFWPRV